jgi:hypothetical protein
MDYSLMVAVDEVFHPVIFTCFILTPHRFGKNLSLVSSTSCGHIPGYVSSPHKLRSNG